MAMGSSPPPPEEIRSPEQDKAAEDASAAQGEEEEQFDDAFDIPHKNASHDSLLRWRVLDPSLTLSCLPDRDLSSFWCHLVLAGNGIGTCQLCEGRRG
jgi:hypothetical protein